MQEVAILTVRTSLNNSGPWQIFRICPASPASRTSRGVWSVKALGWATLPPVSAPPWAQVMQGREKRIHRGWFHLSVPARPFCQDFLMLKSSRWNMEAPLTHGNAAVPVWDLIVQRHWIKGEFSGTRLKKPLLERSLEVIYLAAFINQKLFKSFKFEPIPVDFNILKAV